MFAVALLAAVVAPLAWLRAVKLLHRHRIAAQQRRAERQRKRQAHVAKAKSVVNRRARCDVAVDIAG
jgi:hypothetical protein